MVDISDLPLTMFASGKLFAGVDDIVRMEQASEALLKARAEIEAKAFMLPEQKKRKLAAIDSQLKLLSQATIFQKEHINLDPDRSKTYVELKDQVAREAKQTEIDKDLAKKKSGWGPGSWFGGGGKGDGDISGR